MIHIREATEQDFSSICDLMKNELGYPDLTDTESIKRLEHISHNNDWATFVSIIDFEVVGFFGVMKGLAYEIEGFYSQIMALAVSDKARRNGVGTALVKKAEEWSLSQGIKCIGVRSNELRLDAHTFYEKNGYINTKRSLLFEKVI